MNEQIKELVEQAKCYADEHNAHYLQNPHWIETFEEKFSELIVRQCIEICETEKADYTKYRKGAWDFEEKNIYAEGEAACDIIKHKIKRKFGVN